MSVSVQHPLSATNHPLVGREEETAKLHACLQSVLQRKNANDSSAKSTVVFVHGKSGVGKTALIDSCLKKNEWAEENPAATNFGEGKNSAVTTEAASSSSKKIIWMARGKYEQFQDGRGRPYSAILKALDSLGENIQESLEKLEDDDDDAPEKDYLERHMRSALKFEGRILTKMVPSLASYRRNREDLDGSDESDFDRSDDTMQVTLASERLAVALMTFLKHFCAFIGPLVLFLDDVQWADAHSQDLIRTLTGGDGKSESLIEKFLLILGHRDEDEGSGKYSAWMQESSSPVCDIHVQNLTVEQVADLLRAVLQVRDRDEDTSNNRRDVNGLAQIVFQKTFGNPYYVLQQLEYLHHSHESILQYNFATASWEWDLEQTRLHLNSSDNVVHVVTSRVARVPIRVKRLLQLASCLGYFVELNVLEKLEQHLFGDAGDDDVLACLELSSGERRQQSGGQASEESRTESATRENNDTISNAAVGSFQEALTMAENQAFIECTGGILKFSHDRIQQSVYELLVDKASRASAIDLVHYRIAMHFREQWEATQEERALFLAVEQLDRVSQLYLVNRLSREEILSLISLNHQASKLAKKKGRMHRVSVFLNMAISLAEHQPHQSLWQTQYEMMLELYISSAEVEFGLGRLDASTGRIAVIHKYAIQEVDQVRAMVIQFQMYGHQRQFAKAIAEGRKIVKLLGEPLPKTSLINIMREYFAIKKETRKKPDAFFIELRKTRCPEIQTVLKVLQISSVYGWNGDPLYSGLAFLRAMRITVREGSDVTTPYIYSGYAYMLGLFNDEKEAFRFGEIALDKNEGKITFPSSCPLTYTTATHFQLPIAVGLEPLLASYRVGLETGDLFFGTVCISCYALVYFSCGLPLRPFASDMRNYMSQLKICKQDIPLAFILPTCQLALNLMGMSDDPMELSRNAIMKTQPEFFSQTVLLDKNDSSVLYMMYLEAFELFILGASKRRLESAMREICKLPETRLGGPHIMNYFFTFVDGLVGLRLTQYAAKKRPEKWRKTKRFGNKLANQAIKQLRKWVKTRPVNSVSLLALLEAEQASHSRKASVKVVQRMYDRAISQFARSGLIHYGTIANELAGLYMAEKNDKFWAKHYLLQACIRYSEWNADVKVQMLNDEYDTVEFDEHRSAHFAIQGKSRFDAARDSMDPGSTSLGSSLEKFTSRSLRNDSDNHRMSVNRYSGKRISGLS